MKRTILAASLSVLSIVVTSVTFGATSIGVNFQGRDGTQAGPYPGTPPLGATEVAGVVTQSNWNNVDDANNFAPA